MTGRQRLARILVRLYPSAWRREFGVEFTDLLERSPLDVPRVVNVLLGAAGERAVQLIRRMTGGNTMNNGAFEARYDGLAWILSLVLVVVLLTIPLLMLGSGWMAGVTAAISVAVVGLSYAYSPRGYEITGGELRVKRLVGDVVFPLTRLRFVRDATTSDYWGCIRLWGSSGMFGYYGRYWSRDLGACRWYVTDRSRALIVTDGKGMILLSPDNRDGFVAALQEGNGSTLEPGSEKTGGWGRRVTVGGFLGVALVIVSLALTAAAFRYDPGRPPVELRRDELEIHSWFYGMTVEAASVDVNTVRVVDLLSEKDWRPVRRVGGFGNSHYRAGNFRTANGRAVKLFTTGSQKLVLLPPRTEAGMPVLLDVTDPERFAEQVREAWKER